MNRNDRKCLYTTNGTIITLGSVLLNISVESTPLKVKCYILRNADMRHVLLLGKSLLMSGDIIFMKDGMKFRPRVDNLVFNHADEA